MTKYSRQMSTDLALANVLAHCGGSPLRAAHHLSRAIAAAPHEPLPYKAVAELLPALGELLAGDGEVAPMLAFRHFLEGDMDEAALAIGALGRTSPRIAWANAPWFTDERFLSGLSAEALCEAALRLFDRGAEPDAATARPWLRVVRAVASRPGLTPENLARMAILLRAFGLPEESLAVCDRADAVGRTALTEVVRGGTWRALGNLDESAAAFRRAVEFEPDNWSLRLDLSDPPGAVLASAEAGLLREQVTSG